MGIDERKEHNKNAIKNGGKDEHEYICKAYKKWNGITWCIGSVVSGAWMSIKWYMYHRFWREGATNWVV